MSEYLRLVYVSRATFPTSRASGAIDLEVGRILMQSKRNNARRGLVGALYYSEGCFFQCLEGSNEEVEGLYARLHDDPRHKDLKVLKRQAIGQLSFSGWAMKYVPNAAVVQGLLSRHSRRSFDPYAFDGPIVDDMIDLLVRGADAAPAMPPSAAAQPGSSVVHPATTVSTTSSVSSSVPTAAPAFAVAAPTTPTSPMVSSERLDVLTARVGVAQKLSIVATLLAAAALVVAILR